MIFKTLPLLNWCCFFIELALFSCSYSNNVNWNAFYIFTSSNCPFLCLQIVKAVRKVCFKYKHCIPSSASCSHCYYIRIIQTAQSAHPADDLEEALRQFARLYSQQRNIRIYSKQPQLPVFLHAVKSWAIKEKSALQNSNKYQHQITEHDGISWVCGYLTLRQQFKETVWDVRLHHVSTNWKHCVHGLNEPFIIWSICIKGL